MCGRFVQETSIPELCHEFGAHESTIDHPPNYNVAPSQKIAIIRKGEERRIELCRWGFIPSWSKDQQIGYKMINARAESVAEKPSFRNSFKSKRVLIPADGFYEWKKHGKSKMPFYIRLKSGKPFGMAGLYNIWASPNSEQICTCTIITTEANTLLEAIHNRMPVMIRKEDESLWLDKEEQDVNKLQNLLMPYLSEKMQFYPVSALVNSPRNNSPECIKPSNQLNS